MDLIQAHKILNEVKEGIWHSQNDIVRALVTTGDIDVRCFKLDSSALSRGTDSHSPFVHHDGLQVLEGEPR